MDNVLLALFTWQFILFCLATFGITVIIRRIAEYLLANNKYFAKESKLWRDLLLPLLPIGIGIIFAVIAKAYPYPVDMHATSARVAWGLAGGLLSGLGYRVVNSFVTAFILSKIPNASISDPNILPDPVSSVITTIPVPAVVATPVVTTTTTTVVDAPKP